MELVAPEICQSDHQKMDDDEDVKEEAEALDSNVGRRTSCSADVETAGSEEESDSDVDNCSTDSVEAEGEEGRVLQDGPRSPARGSAATPLADALNLVKGPQKRASAKAKGCIEFRSDMMSPQWMFFLDSENKQGFLTIRGTVYLDDWNTNFNSSGDRASPVYAEYKHSMPAAKSALSMGTNPEEEKELGPFLMLHKGFYDRAATAIMELEVELWKQSKKIAQQEQRVAEEKMSKDEGGRDEDDGAGTSGSEREQTVETETAPVMIRDSTSNCDPADEEVLAFEKQAGTESHKSDVFRNFAEEKTYLEKRQTKLPTCFVEYLKKNIATKISDKLFLQGHSLGGAAALVIHRLREKSDLLQAMTNNSAGKKIHTNAFSAPPMFTSGSPEQAKLAFVYLATGKLANWALDVNRVLAGDYRCSWLEELATEFPDGDLNKQETILWKNSTNLFFNFDFVPRLAFMNVQKEQIVLPPVEKVFWLRDTAPAGLQEKLDKCGKSCSKTLTRVATVFRVPLYAQATVLSSLDQMLSPYPKEFLLDAVQEHQMPTYEPLLVALLGGKNSKKDSQS
ncbi:unnamed protein product [Amoebophrya sp. A120]|nr:unnamed protein product [Amoebophrya sp. A120]|eukprot:GSA120T00011875001.1